MGMLELLLEVLLLVVDLEPQHLRQQVVADLELGSGLGFAAGFGLRLFELALESADPAADSEMRTVRELLERLSRAGATGEWARYCWHDL